MPATNEVIQMTNIHLQLEKRQLEDEIKLLDIQLNRKKVKLYDMNKSIDTQTAVRDKIMEDIAQVRVDLEARKTEANRQMKVYNDQLRDTAAIVGNRNRLLNKVGMLSLEDKTLDQREMSQRKREKTIEEKAMEIKGTLQQLEEQKQLAETIRSAQSSSYYHPTTQEEEFFTKKRGDFLESYEKVGNIAKAAQETGIRPSLISYYKKKYPEFSCDLAIAYDVFKDRLDGEVLDRAMNGVEKTSFYKGEAVETYIEKSDGLLVAAAKAHVPERYDRGKLDRIEGSTTNNVTVNMVSYKDINPNDFGAVANVGVVNFVGEHGDIKRITNDKMSQHDLAIDPSEVVIEAEMVQEQEKSVVFQDDDED